MTELQSWLDGDPHRRVATLTLENGTCTCEVEGFYLSTDGEKRTTTGKGVGATVTFASVAAILDWQRSKA